MNCEKCSKTVDEDDVREHNGRILCEDCHMDALSPAKTCDPWAVHCAKSMVLKGGAGAALTETQQNILEILKESGGMEPADLMEKTGLSLADFERHTAALRHMEKLRAELRNGVKVICLW